LGKEIFSMKDIILKISNDFSFSYGTNKLFSSKKNISFEKGKIYGIYGSNGTGKTSFLNILNTFTVPTTGIIEYNFKNILYSFDNKDNNKTTKIISNNIRRCFQIPMLVDELSIIDNIVLGKREYRNERFIDSILYTKGNNYKDIKNLLEQLNINPNNTASVLSYGQRRIIANLQILYTSPDLILLDEPFVGLHSDVIQFFKDEYLKKATLGTTIILVEHLAQNLKNFADEYLIIKNKELKLVNNYVGLS